jgi:hypothetical protein
MGVGVPCTPTRIVVSHAMVRESHGSLCWAKSPGMPGRGPRRLHHHPPAISVGVTAPHRGFTHVHPSHLSLTLGPLEWQLPFRLFLRLRTKPLPASHAEAGTNLDTGWSFLPGEAALSKRPTSRNLAV